MTKTRRVVRKVDTHSGRSFDERLWPVNVALAVLAAFLVGMVVAYRDFRDPIWYRNGWFWVALIPTTAIAIMVTLRFVDNRTVRRAVQLATILSILIHILFLLWSLEATLFGRRTPPESVARKPQDERPRVVVPEYAQHHFADPLERPQQDYEKPVETETPDTPAPEVARQETQPEPPTPIPQPTPTPEPQPQRAPTSVVKQQMAETAPRAADQSSQLSRKTSTARVVPNQTAEAPTSAAPTPAEAPKTEPSPDSRSVARRPTERALSQAAPSVEAAAPTERSTTSAARSSIEPTARPETSATPTLPRQPTEPRATPRSAVAAADVPAPTRQTSPDAPRPATTATTRREVTDPLLARQPAVETPATPAPTPSPSPQRQLTAPEQPTVAAAPTPVPNQRTRMTTRTEVATTAPTATPQPMPVVGETAPLTPRTSPVRRAAPATTAQATTAAPADPTTAPANAPTAANVARREASKAPSATPADTNSPSIARQTPRANLTPTAAAADPAVAAAQQSQVANSPNPAALATRKQDTASPQVARAAGDPTATAGPAAPSPASVANAARSGAAADSPSPNAGNSPSAATTGRQTPNAMPNVVTEAAAVAANVAPRAAADVQAATAASQVARQTNATPGATRVQTPLETPTASASAQVARNSTPRAEAAAVPSVNPTAPATSAPARTVQSSPTAASPSAVESPALSVAAQGTGEPAAQPQPTAVTRSQAGMAGAGQSANLDRAAPAGESPALVAAGAAQRSQATQITPEGPALAPSEAAVVRRSVAGQARPSATLQAEPIPSATAAGVAQPSQLAASAGAAVTQASSNASPGAVNAAAGRVEVDTGPTQVVSEKGAGRASGGGQPDASTAPDSAVIARSRTGGSPQMSIAATPVAAMPVSPGETGGGAPAPTPFTAQATATVRNSPGGEAPLTGGPSAAAAPGATVEVSAAPQVAEAARSRADAAAGSAGSAAGGQPDASKQEEEEQARRLARSASGGAPQIAATGPATVEAPAGTPATGGESAATVEASQLAAAMSRSGPSGAARAELVAAAPAAAGEPAAGAMAAELVASTPTPRAEAAEAAAGAPALGGGASSPTRSSTGPSLPAATQAAELAVSGQPASSGAAQGVPIEAQGLAAAKTAGGARGAPSADPVGTVAAETPIEASAPGLAGGAPGRRQATSGAADAPSATALESGGPLRRADSVAAGAVTATPVEVPDLGAEVEQANVDHLAAAAAKGMRKAQTGGGPLSVDLAALEGPGGLGSQATPDVGIQDRRAQEESLDVQPRAARFQRQQVGGLPSVSTAAVLPTDSFRQRTSRNPGSGGRNGSPPPQTEEAIEMGLAFLARYQGQDGSWSLSGFGEEVALSSDTAATGLGLLAFQGAGYNHREHKYQEVVRAALDHLVKNQKPDGDLFTPMDDDSNRSVWLYSHSIAALAVCEAYGMTQDPALKEPAQKAVDFIVAAQHKQRGGWRYAPGVGADTSVTGWMMMALKSGELAGLKVPQETFVGMQRWLDSAQASAGERHLYRYNPLAPDTESQRHGRQATRTMTSVGLLMRLYLGWRRDNPDMVRGADYLLQAPPEIGTARNIERDTYYWYYATQVMFHVGGERWQQWNDKLHPLLVSSQVRQGPLAGSWDPRNPVPDRWAQHAGRLYVTTLNLLSLEVYYRHLPLYVETAK